MTTTYKRIGPSRYEVLLDGVVIGEARKHEYPWWRKGVARDSYGRFCENPRFRWRVTPAGGVELPEVICRTRNEGASWLRWSDRLETRRAA